MIDDLQFSDNEILYIRETRHKEKKHNTRIRMNVYIYNVMLRLESFNILFVAVLC